MSDRLFKRREISSFGLLDQIKPTHFGGDRYSHYVEYRRSYITLVFRYTTIGHHLRHTGYRVGSTLSTAYGRTPQSISIFLSNIICLRKK